MKFLCLINPVAGGGKGRALIERLKTYKASGTFIGEIEELNPSAIKSQLERGRSYDSVLIGGGDGSVSQVIAELDGSHPPIGLLPLGTGNDLAKESGIYRHFSISNPLQLILRYRKNQTKDVTVWKIEFDYNEKRSVRFLNYVSFGMEGRVVNRFSRWRKSPFYRPVKLFGVLGNRSAYGAAGLSEFFYRLKLDKAKIAHDGIPLQLSSPRCISLIFANIRSMMGLGISNSHSSFLDEKIELVMTDSPLNYLSMISRLRGPIPAPKFLGSGGTWAVSGLPKGTALQIDGESRPDVAAESYTISPDGRVKLLTV